MIYSLQQPYTHGVPVQEEYFTVKEVADRLRVTRQAVYDWIREGRLRAVKVGNRTRIPGSAVEQFIQPINPGESLEELDEEE